jgi:hypothetical protein
VFLIELKDLKTDLTSAFIQSCVLAPTNAWIPQVLTRQVESM